MRNAGKTTYLLSVPSDEQIRQLLQRVFDPDEFLSSFGMRSLSKVHSDAPFRFGGHEIRYEAAEAESKIKGGNSNWRGPVWFPVGFLMIESLRKLGTALDPELRLMVQRRDGEAPAEPTLFELAEELANRMIRLFVPDESGRVRYTAARSACSTIATGTSISSSMSTSTARPDRASGPRIRPGPHWSPH